LLGCCGGGKGVYSFFSLVVTFFCLTFFLRISYKSNLKYKKYKQQKRMKEIDYIHTKKKKKIAIDVVLLEFRKKPIPVFVCKCWVLFKFFLHHKNLLRREREREREREIMFTDLQA
jgi:Na+/H+ antiporter NhaD/arsenite permease-like protein